MYTNFDELPVTLHVKHIENILDIGRVQAYRLVKSPGFPSMKVGGAIRVSKPLFIEWIREQSANTDMPENGLA